MKTLLDVTHTLPKTLISTLHMTPSDIEEFIVVAFYLSNNDTLRKGQVSINDRNIVTVERTYKRLGYRLSRSHSDIATLANEIIRTTAPAIAQMIVTRFGPTIKVSEVKRIDNDVKVIAHIVLEVG